MRNEIHLFSGETRATIEKELEKQIKNAPAPFPSYHYRIPGDLAKRARAYRMMDWNLQLGLQSLEHLIAIKSKPSVIDVHRPQNILEVKNLVYGTLPS
jgi:hypothetical protein